MEVTDKKYKELVVEGKRRGLDVVLSGADLKSACEELDELIQPLKSASEGLNKTIEDYITSLGDNGLAAITEGTDEYNTLMDLQNKFIENQRQQIILWSEKIYLKDIINQRLTQMLEELKDEKEKYTIMNGMLKSFIELINRK